MGGIQIGVTIVFLPNYVDRNLTYKALVCESGMNISTFIASNLPVTKMGFKLILEEEW